MEKLNSCTAELMNARFGHNNEADQNTVILRIRLTDGVLFHHGERYEIDFTESV